MRFHSLIQRFTLSLLLLSFTIPIVAQSPNIVFVLTDDQGWTGTSSTMDSLRLDAQSDYYKTPRLDQFVKEGMRFSRAYSPGPMCSPSRCSLLSGKNPARSKFTNVTTQVAMDEPLIEVSSRNAIEDSVTTIGELIQSLPNLNYRTAHFGKWHIRNNGTASNGFDQGDGDTDNGEGDNGGSVQSDPKDIFSLTQRAKDFMIQAASANEPFYLQVSHYAVHTPVEATQSSLNLYNDPQQRQPGTTHTNASYGAMTEDLDTGLGILLDALDSLGLSSNTYVIFMSDNGGANGQSSNRPLSRGKMFLQEGGIRVPLVIRGPDVPANSQCDHAVVGYDLFPTIVEWITGSTQLVPVATDGGSLVPTFLSGGSVKPVRSQELVFHSPHYADNPNKKPVSVIMEDEWKLLVDYETGSFELYDVQTDVGETQELSSMFPDKVYELGRRLRDYFKLVDADLPTLNPAHSSNPGPAPDADNDGLTDEWEFRELLTAKYGANDDPDQDGANNLQEMNDGTDPYSPMNVGIGEELQIAKLNIGPNPFQDRLWVRVESEDYLGTLQLELRDVSGRLVWNGEMESNQRKGFELGELVAGVYFLQVKNKDGQALRQEIVMKR